MLATVVDGPSFLRERGFDGVRSFKLQYMHRSRYRAGSETLSVWEYPDVLPENGTVCKAQNLTTVSKNTTAETKLAEQRCSPGQLFPHRKLAHAQLCHLCL